MKNILFTVGMLTAVLSGGSICTGAPYMVGPYVQVLHI